MNKTITPICTAQHRTIREVMKLINDGPKLGAPSGLALVIDDQQTLLGLVTDGDIRRAILNNVSLETPVSEIMVKDPVTVPADLSYSEILDVLQGKIGEAKLRNRLRDGRINHIIVVDEEKHLKDVLTFFDLWKNAEVKTRNVCVLGLGFVGLTLAVTFADIGTKVHGVDPSEHVRGCISEGKAHFHELGLDPLIKRYYGNNFTTGASLEESHDVYIISVGTPVDPQKNPDMKYVRQAAESIAKYLKKGDLVILRSTVPVGTCRKTVVPLLEASGLKAGKDFYLTFAPERTVEGKALQELRTLPQIIGGVNRVSVDMAANLFRQFAPHIVDVGSLEEAEMVKLINNSFRDVSFGFANEFSLLCDKLNLDAAKIIKSANDGYPRNRIPLPSPGVGGVCLKKDPYIYSRSGMDLGQVGSHLALQARRVNEHMPSYVAQKMDLFLREKGKDKGSKLFIVGFAFKGRPETSDMRDSPTLDLVSELKKFGYTNVCGYDPVVPKSEVEQLGVSFEEVENGFTNADAVIIMNNHISYAKFDIYALLEKMNKPSIFFDGWHLFPPDDIMSVEGVSLSGLGYVR